MKALMCEVCSHNLASIRNSSLVHLVLQDSRRSHYTTRYQVVTSSVTVAVVSQDHRPRHDEDSLVLIIITGVPLVKYTMC
jgi:hypothetical protein